MRSVFALSVILFLLAPALTSVCAQDVPWPIGRWESRERKRVSEIEIFKGTDGLLYGRLVTQNNKPAKDTGLIIRQLKASKKPGQYTGLLTVPGYSFDMELTMYAIDGRRAEMIAGRFGMVKWIKLNRKN